MGELNVREEHDGQRRRAFMRCLLNDVRALEKMIAEGLIESGVRRVGAEQELFLVDRHWRPAPLALEMLELLGDERFTTELALFNLEANLDPLLLGGDALSRMEEQLVALLERAREAAAELGAHCVLAGILPTLRKSDLDLDNMTPMPRYRALNSVMKKLRGGAYEFRIRGVDELIVKHDSIMVEACNCSFQVHFQVGAAEFAELYNVAQAVAGPTLAAASNSPLLFGRRLWRETRIATFQQAVDTRSSSDHLRELSPRVSFGRGWVRDSVVELFREDIARFRVLFSNECEEDSMEALERGEIPRLSALRLHNGTVYRWNRACYGLTEGKPHLRIENRILPSGPTPRDEIANAALWLGLVSGVSRHVGDVTKTLDFEAALGNFENAARAGLSAQFEWFGGRTMPARELLVEELLPLAREGLAAKGIDSADADLYLGTIEERVQSGRTGAQWLIEGLGAMREEGTLGERLNALTAGLVRRQEEAEPVARWEPARLDEGGGWQSNYLKVEQYMTTDVLTVHEEEAIDLVASLMDWHRIRHVPVEDDQHNLVGLVSYRSLLRHLARGGAAEAGRGLAVREVMRQNPLVVTPETRTLEAIKLMREARIGCLPVVKDGRLVGVVVERDFMDIASELLAEKLHERS